MKMNYFVVGTNDIERSAKFYDTLFESQSVSRVKPTERMVYWIGDDFAFATALPFNKEPATIGNGTMVGFSVGAAQDVQAIYEKAIDLGATSEGSPNQRGPRYSAYVRDLDGNKLCFSD
ncbi:MAG: VOC family protein [Boseongicola sp.]|nr:MAG: VOC family protein [Boseongicola sp.]